MFYGIICIVCNQPTYMYKIKSLRLFVRKKAGKPLHNKDNYQGEHELKTKTKQGDFLTHFQILY